MDSNLSGGMSKERFKATSKDVVKAKTAVMVLFTAEKYANMVLINITHGVVYAMSYIYTVYI